MFCCFHLKSKNLEFQGWLINSWPESPKSGLPDNFGDCNGAYTTRIHPLRQFDKELTLNSDDLILANTCRGPKIQRLQVEKPSWSTHLVMIFVIPYQMIVFHRQTKYKTRANTRVSADRNQI